MIKFDKLTKYYGNVCAVDNISFEVKKGEILGFLGPNGAGKTTTYRILTGYLQATSGTIKVKDYDIHEERLEIKKLIGYLPESAPVYQDMLVYDYLNYIADIRDVPEDKKLSHIKSLADLCSLNEVMHKAVNELSKGYRQRVGIAHALMGDPEILVLDEPTVGLDPNQIVETRDIIKRIGKEKTIIFSTHILSEAVATCDRIVIINNGKLAADYTMDELQELLKNESIEDLFRKITKGNH
jgi:ABC-2 type transport system ATP-binding protein